MVRSPTGSRSRHAEIVQQAGFDLRAFFGGFDAVLEVLRRLLAAHRRKDLYHERFMVLRRAEIVRGGTNRRRFGGAMR